MSVKLVWIEYRTGSRFNSVIASVILEDGSITTWENERRIEDALTVLVPNWDSIHHYNLA